MFKIYHECEIKKGIHIFSPYSLLDSDKRTRIHGAKKVKDVDYANKKETSSTGDSRFALSGGGINIPPIIKYATATYGYS